MGAFPVAGAVNGIAVNKDELFKGGLLQPGREFYDQSSVDVKHNDATTGADKSNSLVLQALTYRCSPNLPNFINCMASSLTLWGMCRVPWMKKHSRYRSCASVKNGYESIGANQCGLLAAG